jgi:hypothetical protein
MIVVFLISCKSLSRDRSVCRSAGGVVVDRKESNESSHLNVRPLYEQAHLVRRADGQPNNRNGRSRSTTTKTEDMTINSKRAACLCSRLSSPGC